VGDSRRLIALAERPGVWHFDTIESDAELLVIQSSAATVEDVLISGGSEVRIGGAPLTLEGKIDGIWEAVANAETGSLLSTATATELLKVLERLSDSGRS
jgi:hypothetical protein